MSQTGSGTALTLGGTGAQPSQLYFDVGSNSDGIALSTGKVVVNTGGAVINITGLTGFALGNYTLISAPGFFTNQAGFSLASTTINVNGTNYNLSLTNSTSTAEILTVSPVQSSTTLTVTGPVTGSYGGPVTLTATLTSGGSGVSSKTVTFTLNGTTVSPTATTDVNGVATLNNVNLPTTIGVGTYPSGVYASFTADTLYLGSSDTEQLAVSKATSTTTVSPSAGPATFGNAVTFTATVSPQFAGTPSGGTVTFSDGGTSIGTGTLSSGKYTLTETLLSAATHSITASYDGAGDANFLASATSPTVNQTVNQASTSTTITASTPNPLVDGNPVTFTASVSYTAGGGSLALTGTVTFFEDSSTSLGTASFSGASGSTTTFTTSSIEPAGETHSITAVYAPTDSTNIAGSPASSAYTQTVKQTTSTTVTSSSASSTFGDTVTLTATVTVSSGSHGTWAPNGIVTFLDGASSLATASLSGLTTDTATFTISTLAAVTHTITAAYSGDSFDAADTQAQRMALLQTVNQATTTTTVTGSSSPVSSVFGQSVTFTATVSSTASGMSGTVTFSDGSMSIGTGTVNGGTATYSTSALQLAAGTDQITAVYGGDVNFNYSSPSASFPQSVAQASTTTTVTSSLPTADQTAEFHFDAGGDVHGHGA